MQKITVESLKAEILNHVNILGLPMEYAINLAAAIQKEIIVLESQLGEPVQFLGQHDVTSAKLKIARKKYAAAMEIVTEALSE